MADPGFAKPHALFVSAPFQGHFTPAANFAVKLAAKGFIVTFVNTEAFHHQRVASGALSPDGRDDGFSDARSKGLDIRYEIVSDGLPLSLDRTVYADQFAYAANHLLSGHVEELMRKLLLRDPPIDVFIADTFFVWHSTLAKKFGLPYVSFWTEPALVFTLFCHMSLLVDNGHFGFSSETRKDAITCIPGVPAIEPTDLMSFFQGPETSSSALRILGKVFEGAKGADFVLCNTVQELEAETIAALERERSFYAVGPIVPEGFAGDTVTTSLRPESDCSKWLDSMPPGSVLYMSFGSIVQVSNRDLEEIAYGVLNSKANFLWALRPGSAMSEAAADDDRLPEGFAEASRGRGLIVPWCRQKEVLLHPAVGVFFTHCGWNSILESMWCGVPMLCFPVLWDQPTNRKLVVQDLRIGISVGGVGEVVRDEVSSRIDSLMGGEVGVTVRREMEEVRKAVKSAVTPGGSSCKNLDRFTVDLLKHLAEKRSSVEGGKTMD